MTIETELLIDIYKQVSEQFSSHKIISVTPLKGDPPHHYEVTYTIPGMTLVKDDKVNGTLHVVEISIPFGFPHFPPSCKPKSNIFHPDFDSAAICLGDFWENNQSLPDLFIHIGRMIAGELYSTENAFNNRAATWYLEHQEQLPFSTALAPAAAPTTLVTPAVPDTPAIQAENKDNQIKIDTLDDSDLFTDYNYLSPDNPQEKDESSFLDESLFDEQTEPEIDLSSLQHLDKQKKYFKLLETIKKLPSSSKEVELFLSDAQIAINSANEYDKIAQQNEKRGNSGLALEEYEKAAGQVADFPSISAKISRMKRSLELLNEAPEEVEPQPESQTNSTDKLDELNLNVPQNTKNHISSPLSTSSAPETVHPWHQRKRVRLLIILFLILHAGGIGIFFYVKAQKEELISAEHLFNQCQAQLDADNFTSAKNSCETALQLSEKSGFSQQQGTIGLTSKIQTILHSEKLRQGLAGKTLIDGNYLTKADTEAVSRYKKLGIDGADLFEQSQWSSAIEKLQQAIDIAHNNPFVDTTTLHDLIFKLQQAKLQILLQNVTENIHQKAWKDAITSSSNALTYLEELPSDIQQQYRTQLEQNIANSRFEDLKNQADTFFAESDWQNAASFYERLQTLGKNNNDIPLETLTEVSTNIARAKLYHSISSGNMAFSSGSWDDAILAYQHGQSLLADDKALHTLIDSDVNIRKIAKIILQISVIKNSQSAQKMVEENNLQGAKTSHQKIIQLIKASSFADNDDFLNIVTESSETIQSLEQEIILSEKHHYLETNYKTIFTTNYPATFPENLSDPLITLVKESPENFLFKLQCTETNRGRRLFLVIYYAYDKKSGTWKLSSGSPQLKGS